jgi:poly(hydroxyalkanoate) depolymerase family esterase
MKLMSNLNRTMQEAMRLMKTGDLGAATDVIQRSLQGHREVEQPMPPPPASGAADACIEGQYRVVPEAANDPKQTVWTMKSPEQKGDTGVDGVFLDHHFTCDAGAMHYKLFIPSGLGDAPPPLLVMLHGCTQSPDDFARGTRMNALAQEHGYVVAYPAQAKSKNASKCWNWFRSQDQQRGQGEPAIIAALTRYLAKIHGLDKRRLYVAGLSAGGAMATVLASTYPDVYAAIGVHSGLPVGVAHDLPSAFAAMKQGSVIRSSGAQTAHMDRVPAIVFHGDRDTTVDPCNGEAVIAQCIGATPSAPSAEFDTLHTTVERGSIPGGRTYTRTVYKNPDGSVTAERWVVHGAAHAWFGGDPAGSYTDPSGPDASKQMLRFFSLCARSPIN